MLKAHKPVENLKPDLPAKTFDSWNQFQSTVADYKAKYFLHFRVRSSTKHNRFQSISPTVLSAGGVPMGLRRRRVEKADVSMDCVLRDAR
ncbi:hypothetical protein PI124_g20758 [Phytophthora idaei]|nr:hypothetical protein PI124_g20758 [Phytophthora idaei]